MPDYTRPAEQLIRCALEGCSYAKRMVLNGELARSCPGCHRPAHWLITLPEPPPLVFTRDDCALLKAFHIRSD